MTIPEVIYRTTPEYQMAFEEGFEACKMIMLEKIKNLSAFITVTSTQDFAMEVSNAK